MKDIKDIIEEWREAKDQLDHYKTLELHLRKKIASKISKYEDADYTLEVKRPVRLTVDEKKLEEVRDEWREVFVDFRHLDRLFKITHKPIKKAIDEAFETYPQKAQELIARAVTEKEGLATITIKEK